MDDVIIVGAGPIGNYLASKLAGLGYRTTVLEQQTEVARKICCTGILGKECLEAFPVPGEFVLREAYSATVYSPNAKTLRVEKDTPQAYVVERKAYQQWLAVQAQQKGARYLLGCSVKNIRVSKDNVRLETSDGIMESRTVAVASGVNSSLLRRMGLEDRTDFAIGAQAEVSSKVNEVELYSGRQIAPGFFAWLVPARQGYALAGLFCRRQAPLYLRKFFDVLYKQDKIGSLEAVPSYKRVPLAPLSRTYRPRMLLVGEAAGQVKATTGGGVYYGLICADIAADVLNSALTTGDFSAKRFSQYQKEWKRRLGREIRIGRFARGLFQHLGDRQIDQIIHLAQIDGIQKALLDSPDFSFDRHGELIIKALKYTALKKLLGPARMAFGKRT